MQGKEIRVGGFRESFPEEKMSGFNACREGTRDGRRLVRKMEGGRVGKRVFNSKDFISIPQPKELWQSERGPGSSGLALIQSRVPAPVATTAAPAAEPRVPHACPPGTAPPQPDLSTWLTLPSRGFQGRGKGSPRTFSFSSQNYLQAVYSVTKFKTLGQF